MIYAILVFLFVVIGTVFIYMSFGGNAGASEVQRVKDRLLGKSKPQKSQSGQGDTPALIKSDQPESSVAQKLLDNLKLKKSSTQRQVP